MRAVYREYGRLVFAVALRALGDRGLAEEVTQQCFVKAWRASAQIDENRELGPWLVAIARRTAIDVYRRESLRAGSPLEGAPADDLAPVTAFETGTNRWEQLSNWPSGCNSGCKIQSQKLYLQNGGGFLPENTLVLGANTGYLYNGYYIGIFGLPDPTHQVPKRPPLKFGGPKPQTFSPPPGRKKAPPPRISPRGSVIC